MSGKEKINDFKEKANLGLSKVATKIEEVARFSSLKLKKSSKLSAIFNVQAKIGKLVYETKGDITKLSSDKEIKKFIQEIDVLNEEIRALDKETQKK